MMLNFYVEKRFPTVKELYMQLKNDVPDLPDFSERTLNRWLHKLKFSFKKLMNKPVLMEHPAISSQRTDFLLALQKYRNEGWKIFYTDETWCGANHAKQFGWVEKVNPENKDSFDHYRGSIQQINGYRGGIKRPSGAGQRVIILHIGSEEGFLPGCLKCFIGVKDKAKADYHHEMNKQHYEEWFRYVLSIIPSKSVIMIDQARYHTMLDPQCRNPTLAWQKNNIIEWLVKRNVPIPNGVADFTQLTKPQLLQISKPFRYEKVYLLDTIVKEIKGDDVKLLWLPVAHCEFNAIELIWAYVKNKVARSNNTFKIKDVLKLCEEAMATVTTEIWGNCIEHCKKIEKYYIEKDKIVDIALEPLIINLEEDCYDEDEEEDDDEDDLSDSDFTLSYINPGCSASNNSDVTVPTGVSNLLLRGISNILTTVDRIEQGSTFHIAPEPI